MSFRRAILILGVVFIVGIVFLGSRYHMTKQRVTDVAKEYVRESFGQEMQFVKTTMRMPIADGVNHRSYFYPTDNPELIFFVEVSRNTFDIVGSTYYSAYFELLMKDNFVDIMSDIWNGASSLEVSVRNTRNKLRTPLDFDGRQSINETLEEMALVFYNSSPNEYSFDFIVNINGSLSSDSDITEEASKILEFISYLQSSNFEPTNLIFHYDMLNPTIFDRIFDNAKIQIRFDEWLDIKTVEQVEELLIKN